MVASPRNMAASVHQRLLNKAREEARPFNEMLQYLAMERFLYRLAQSPYANDFVLKGALMLSAWKVPSPRPTMDIDLLAHTKNDLQQLADIIQRICSEPVERDGFVFDPGSVAASRISADAEYEGVRIRFRGNLGNARLVLQIDVGFGDEIVPGPQDIELPSILGFPVPKIKGYTRESSISEKLCAMLELGELNSRVKDFFDIWLLSRQFDFSGQTLLKAIASVLSNRAIILRLPPSAFENTFIESPVKQSQWQGFLRKSQLAIAPREFSEAAHCVAGFLTPPLEATAAEQPFPQFWKAPGPWQCE